MELFIYFLAYINPSVYVTYLSLMLYILNLF